LCGRCRTLTEEHIIPQSLGGKLSVEFLCKPCNDRLGSEIENVAKEDPSIRLAAEHLKDQIPQIAARLREGQKYFAISKIGKIQGIIKKGLFNIRTTRKDNGSLIQSTKNARKNLGNILLKSTHEEAILTEALNKFDEASDNQKVEISPGLQVTKWRLDKLEPSLQGKMLDVLVPLKIAFEFIACHVGKAIYSDIPQVNEVKLALLQRDRSSKCYTAEYLRASNRNYAPFHGIALEANGPPVVVQLRLFGLLAYRVQFPYIAVEGPRYAYIHYLDKDQEDIKEVSK
jgi:hypothetical protein